MGNAGFDYNNVVPTPYSRRSLEREAFKVVQCPSCLTKFAVAAALLRRNRGSRFHCSRCDQLFTQEEALKQPGAGEPAPPPGANEPISWSKPPQALDADSTRSLEIPKTAPAAAWVGAPHEAATEDENEPDPNQMAFNFPPAPRRRTLSTADMNSGAPAGLFSPAGDNQDRALVAAGPRPAAQQSLTEDWRHYQRPRPWRGALLLMIPLLLLFNVFLFTGLTLKSGTADGALTTWLFPALAQSAPIDLSLESLRFEKLNLENGELLYTISGQLNNRTEQSFGNIVVEGLIFDATGKTIARHRVKADSALAQTRLKSLSLAMIENLQSQSSLKSTPLGPAARRDFVIAFPGYNLPEAAFFSARVYTVTPLR